MASRPNGPIIRCAVRTPASPDGELMVREFLSQNPGWQAKHFLPKDDDEMNTAMMAGEFDRAVFANLGEVLEAVWKGEAQIDAWEASGARIELASPPLADDAQWRSMLGEMYLSLRKWRTVQRRRQIIAAIILSCLALASMAVLFLLVPRAG